MINKLYIKNNRYIKPQLLIVYFNSDDIITSSGCDSDCTEDICTLDCPTVSSIGGTQF